MSASVSIARQAAFEILHRVATEDAFASNLLASGRYENLSREDHGLLQELTLGVLRRQSQLDYLIERYSRRSPAKIDTEVMIALRLGLYQLRFLSRIPSHAAINESVNLVKLKRKQSAAPLVNAVLRSAQREGPFDLRQSIRDPLELLRIETSHPAWLLDRWIKRYGYDEARELALADNTAPRQAFRFNDRRRPESMTRGWLADHGILTRDSAIAPGAVIVAKGSLSADSEPVRKGWLYLQDEASQLVAHLCANRPMSETYGLRMIDLCAAPGSKTTLAATLLPKKSTITACELHPHRLRTMKELSERMGIDRIDFVQLDATQPLPYPPESFDLALLDAPCSGLGTLQRHPEIKWRTTENRIAELSRLQRKLIAEADRIMRPGGLLVYSVCSTEPEEGEEVVADLRESHPEYRDMTRERLLELGIDAEPLLTPRFGARTFPHRHGTEGFFACALWKRK